MSALPLPPVQSPAATAEITRSLPPAPTAHQDQPRSFAAALERQSQHQRSKPTEQPTDQPAASDDGQPVAAENHTSTEGKSDPTSASESADVQPPAPIQPAADAPTVDAQVVAEQAALVATLVQILPSTVTMPDAPGTDAILAVNPNGGQPGNVVATQMPMPDAQAAGDAAPIAVAAVPTGIQNALPVVAQDVAVSSATMPAAAQAPTSQPIQAASAANTQALPADPTAQSAAWATSGLPVAAAAAIAPSAPVQTAIPVGPVAKKNAGETPAIPSAPISTTASTATAPVETAATDTPLPIAAAPVIHDAIAKPVTDQATTTTVPQTTPTATTAAMQSTIQQMQNGKPQVDQKAKDERIPVVQADKITTDSLAPTPNLPSNQPRTVAVDQPLAAAPTSTPANPMDKAVAQQVTRTLVQNLPNGDKMMVLRLTPPELGTVRIEMVERQGVLSARLHAEDDGVRLALEKALPLMRQELRASDAPIRDVQLGDQARFDQSQTDQQGQGAQGRQGGRRRRDDEPVFSIDGVTTARERPLHKEQILGGRADRSGVNAFA